MTTDPTQSPPQPPAEDTPSFTEALEELEQILQRIEGEETDIDALAAELKRAAELLDLARSKLRRAEVEVTQIVESLDGAEQQAEGAEARQGEKDEPFDEEDGEQDDIPF